MLRARESRFEWPRTSSRGHRRQRYRERNGERRGATGRSEKIGEERARSRGTIQPWGKEKGEEGRRKGFTRDEEGTTQRDLFPLASRERMQFKTHTGDRVSSTHTRAWTSLTTSSRTISSCYSFPLVLAASSFSERRKASPSLFKGNQQAPITGLLCRNPRHEYECIDGEHTRYVEDIRERETMPVLCQWIWKRVYVWVHERVYGGEPWRIVRCVKGTA